jgi:hypothetical protein
MYDFHELRQIVRAKTAEVLLDSHRDGLDYLRSHGVAIDHLPVGETMGFLQELQDRERAALLRFPTGFLGSFFRPIFHLGRLRTRPGRRWQIRWLLN